MSVGKKWWSNAVGYIIYPASFQDSNGDGIGDIQGIISRLDYLQELGVSILWIGPIFDSPMDDGGYDVRDYQKINPCFGDMNDLDQLLQEAHKRGLKVLLDMSLNHTSDEHPWFQKALKDPTSKERSYYLIRKGKMVDGALLPPNHWKGFFDESVWTRIEGTDEFYFHLFSKKMPDVDWSNSALREEYYKILRFYLEKGVDGFRLDAIAHLAKDLTFSESELPLGEDGLVLDTGKFSNREELYEYLRMLKQEVFSHFDCLTIGEVGGEISPEDSLKISGKNGGLDMVFNFDTVWNNGAWDSIEKPDEEIKTDVIALKRNFMRWYDGCHEESDLPLYWCNHDHPRVLSQYGSESFRDPAAKMLFLTILFLYGTDFIYNGEEIGMSNISYDSLESFMPDVASRNEINALRQKGYDDSWILHYENRVSRVNARTGMQWENAPEAGFTTGKPIFPVNENYKQGVNILDQMKDPYSILNFYQYAIGIRKSIEISEAVNHGELDIIDWNHPDVFSYVREYNGRKFMVISNFRPYTVYFSFYFSLINILLHNYGDVKLENHVYELRPFESFLLEVR